ncbi:MAG: DJ-1/PfpI family protein [Bacteroidota bacterium]
MKSKQLLLFLFAITLMSCLGRTEDKATPKTYTLPQVRLPEKTLNVGFLIMDGVYNTELTAPMDIFQHTIFHADPGMAVFTVANSDKPVKTFEGLRILPDYNYLEDTLPHIDVLVVPSAEHHLDTDLEDEAMIQFVHDIGSKAQYVVSLCDGSFVLAKADLLNERVSTTFPGDIAPYKAMFPHLDVRENVLFVHDGPFITSAGGARSFDAAMYLAELLYGKKAADGIARGMVIDWDVNQVPAVIIPEKGE